MRFDDAVEEYTTYLLKISFMYTRKEQLAEDIVQDVFLRLYEKFGENIQLENIKAYLVTMTVNKCRDHFKSWHYRKMQLTEIFTQYEEAETTHFANGEDAKALIAAILKLPTNLREVIILYYYDEQSTSSIATLLHIPVGTVKTRLQRARVLLKGHLEEEGEVLLYAQKNG